MNRRRGFAVSSWRQVARINASDPGSGDALGQSLAVDGRSFLAGAWRRAGTRGAAYLFQLPSTVDPDASTVTAAASTISTFGGRTEIVVRPLAGDGTVVGAGLDVQLRASAGALVGPVTDNGDGTYVQVFEGASASAPASAPASATVSAIVSAIVDGIPLSEAATVTLVPASTTTSTVTVDPQQIQAGGSATVTVTPRTGTGSPAGVGFTVTLQTTLGTLIGPVVDNGDGTYTQGIRAEDAGTASIHATVDGLPLQGSASLAVVPKTLGRVVGFDARGSPTIYRTIQHAVRMATKHRLARIVVAPGSYNEFVHVSRRCGLTLETIPGQGLVTIRGIKVRRSTNVVVDGFVLDARGTKRRAISVQSSRRITVRNCLVLGTDRKRDGVYVGAFTRDVVLQDCLVEGCGRDGIRVKTWCGKVTPLRCRVQDNGRNGILVARYSYATIRDCDVTGNGRDPQRRCGGYGIVRQRVHRRRPARPERIHLLGNRVHGNGGRVVAGRSTADFGNYDQMIDATDDQAPFQK